MASSVKPPVEVDWQQSTQHGFDAVQWNFRCMVSPTKADISVASSGVDTLQTEINKEGIAGATV
ncbi:hypothetical protein PG990_001926 [Apiospora arundinis]|uniref:Uncharacterized protein n=1 Tax=Apiospora arundinis TaxID=335852 RepID=A0ABR2I3F6_9PEZI